MGHGVSLNHQNQTQKNHEAKFSINQIIKDNQQKMIKKKIELKRMWTKLT